MDNPGPMEGGGAQATLAEVMEPRLPAILLILLGRTQPLAQVTPVGVLHRQNQQILVAPGHTMQIEGPQHMPMVFDAAIQLALMPQPSGRFTIAGDLDRDGPVGDRVLSQVHAATTVERTLDHEPAQTGSRLQLADQAIRTRISGQKYLVGRGRRRGRGRSAYGQNTPPNRNCPPVLKLRTCVEGLFPLVDSSLPPLDAEAFRGLPITSSSRSVPILD